MTGFGDRLTGICLILQLADVYGMERVYYWDDFEENERTSHLPWALGKMIDLDNLEFIHTTVDSIPKSDLNILNYAYDDDHRPQWKSNPKIANIPCRLSILHRVGLKDKTIEEKANEFAEKLPAIHIRATDTWILKERSNDLDEDQRRNLIVSDIAKAKIKKLILVSDSDQPKYLEDFHMKGIKVKRTNEKFNDSNLRQTSMEQMLFDWWVLKNTEKIYTNIWSGFGATAAAAAGIPYIGYWGKDAKFQSAR